MAEIPVEEYVENATDWSKGDINNSKKFAGWLDDPEYLPEENMGDTVTEVQIFSVPLVDDKVYSMAEGAR